MIAKQRTRRTVRILAAVAVILTAFFVELAIYGSQDHTIHRNAAQLQEMIDKHIPKVSHGVTIEAVKIDLRDNHAEVSIVVSGKKLTKHYHLAATAVGVPDFERSRQGQFYFKPINIQVADVSFDGKSPSEMLQGAAQRYLGKHEGLQRAVIDSAPHIEDWMKDAAQSAMMLALTEIPIYHLKDDNLGWFLRASLKGVKIDGNELHVQFSLWQFTKSLALIAATTVFMLALAIGIIMAVAV